MTETIDTPVQTEPLLTGEILSELGIVKPGLAGADPNLQKQPGNATCTAPENDILRPNRADLSRFVDSLFRYADNGGYVQLRAFRDDTDGTWNVQQWPVIKVNGEGLEHLIDAAEDFASSCATAAEKVVFAAPIATFKGAGAAAEKDIFNGLALSVECDQRALEARQQLESVLGPPTVIIESGGMWVDAQTGEVSPKLHLHWRLTEPTRDFPDHVRLKEARRLATILTGADGTAVPPVHPLRWPGSWHRKGEPRLARIVVYNPDREIELADALSSLRDAIELTGQSRPSEQRFSSDPAADPLDIAGALGVIPNNDLPWDEWNKIGMATWRASRASESGYAAFAAWSSKSRKYLAAETRARWDHYASSPPSEIGAGTLFYLAAQHCQGWRKPSDLVKRSGFQTDSWQAVDHNEWRDPEPLSAVSETERPHPIDAPHGRASPETPDELLKSAISERSAGGQGSCDGGDHSITTAESKKPKQADVLIELAAQAQLFHTADGSGFADIHITGHRETWPIRGRGFRRWLARRFFKATNGAPNSEAMQSALNVIEAKAHFDAPEREVFIRVGGVDGRLYLDLADETWRAVEIDATGWRVRENPPVRFRRTAGMQPLPVPVAAGSIVKLRSFLNARSEADFVLVVAWLLAAFRNRGPYPVLVLSGEQGTAKSTFTKILRGLVDPNTAPLRALPREDRDLFIAASNGFVLAFDNLSALKEWISDTLCRLATGGGFAVRQLYTDQDEVLFEAARPAILNGIEDIVTRPDLADRAIFLTLEPIPEGRRRAEAEIWAEFEAERPSMLGALLNAVATGLKRLPETRLEKLPRMADFALG